MALVIGSGAGTMVFFFHTLHPARQLVGNPECRHVTASISIPDSRSAPVQLPPCRACSTTILPTTSSPQYLVVLVLVLYVVLQR